MKRLSQLRRCKIPDFSIDETSAFSRRISPTLIKAASRRDAKRDPYVPLPLPGGPINDITAFAIIIFIIIAIASQN
jgi:hypothetical protein